MTNKDEDWFEKTRDIYNRLVDMGEDIKDVADHIFFIDNENKLLKEQIEAECREHQEFCEIAKKEMLIRDKALELCCASMCDNMETATPLIEMWMRLARAEVENDKQRD